MSKSLGNVIETNKMLATTSADLSRFYMMRKCSAIDFMNFDQQELSRRTYQVMSTLYNLNKFFLQNAEFDKFTPESDDFAHPLWEGLLAPPDRWVLSKLQATVEAYTNQIESCQFNLAAACLENFVIDTLSKLYVPMIRRELWNEEQKTAVRREVIYAVLHNSLKTITLLFNPITPFISEALYQNVFRKLNPALPESVNFAKWPEPDSTLRNPKVEANFDTLFKCVSLVNAARQTAKLKRRWPLRTVVVATSENAVSALKSVEDLFLEMTNIKEAKYQISTPQASVTPVFEKEWVTAVEGDVTVFISGQRDDKLLGEGIMRDLARRVQALRKELGFMPTDLLESAHIAGLDDESITLLKPFLEEMAELVRTRRVYLHKNQDEVEAKWNEAELDGKKIFVNIH
jgi:valyl-tRNA synthetase